jgi:hypothetical protein
MWKKREKEVSLLSFFFILLSVIKFRMMLLSMEIYLLRERLAVLGYIFNYLSNFNEKYNKNLKILAL